MDDDTTPQMRLLALKLHAASQDGDLKAIERISKEMRHEQRQITRNLFTVAEAAASLGLAPSTIRWQVKNGAIAATKISPRIILISAEQIERYRAEHLGKRQKQER